MVKVSFNVVLSANKACKPDNWPACLAIPLHATLQNQKSKSLKAKSQKQTATCQSHSSEFGLCEPETAWVSEWWVSLSLSAIISSLLPHMAGGESPPYHPAFSSFKKPKKQKPKKMKTKNSERMRERLWKSKRFLFLGTILFSLSF